MVCVRETGWGGDKVSVSTAEGEICIWAAEKE